MPKKYPELEEFEVRENEVVHVPTNARFTAYPGRSLLLSHDHGKLGRVLKNGDDYETAEVIRIATQLLAERPSLRKSLTCEICGQSVVYGPEGPIEFPANYFETCFLRDHMVGNECFAFRDLGGAKRLLADKR